MITTIDFELVLARVTHLQEPVPIFPCMTGKENGYWSIFDIRKRGTRGVVI